MLKSGQKISTVSDNGEITTFEVTTELRPARDTLRESSLKNVAPVSVVLINDTESFESPLNQLTASQTTKTANTSSRGHTYYWWDCIYFEKDGGLIKYPRPARSFNSIAAFRDCGLLGNNLVHFQFSDSSSYILYNGGASVIGAAIGGIICSPTGPQGAILGAVVGAVVGAALGPLIAGIMNATFIDESGCLWWWISASFPLWIYNNAFDLLYIYCLGIFGPAIATGIVADQLLFHTYLRVGSVTVNDPIVMGNP